MADYQGIVLTQKGRALLAKAQTGVVLHFTKVKIGDGEIQQGESLDVLNDLVSPKLTLAITHLQAESNGTCHIRTNITNEGLAQGFFIKEVGLFATDPDLNEEVLYAVTTATNPDYIPADGSATVVNNQFDINILVGNAANIQAVVNPNGLVNQDDFKSHLNKSDKEAHPEALRILNQGIVPTGNEGELTEILNWFANQIKSITGKENWWEDPSNTIAQLDRNDKRRTLQEAINDRAPGSSGSFYDSFVGKPGRMTFLDATADLTAAVVVGATTLPIDIVNGTFSKDTRITIEDDVNQEEVSIIAVNDGSLTVSALTKAYKKGARISRSSVVLDAVNQEMRIGDWGNYTVAVSEVV